MKPEPAPSPPQGAPVISRGPEGWSVWYSLRRKFQRWNLERRLENACRSSVQSGVEPARQSGEVIVSLTTTAARLTKVHLAIESLLWQTRRPQRLQLWISDALNEGSLTPQLRRQQARGLEVQFRPDLRPATKLIYALREFPASVIVTADDDTVYPADWLQKLGESHARAPGMVHCHRAHKMRCDANGALRSYYDWVFQAPGEVGPSPWLFPTGVAGVWYPPGVLHREVFHTEAYLQLCPTADDVWFKAMAVLNGVSCMKVAPAFVNYPVVRGTQRRRLGRENRSRQDEQIRAVFERYDLMSKLRSWKSEPQEPT